MNKENPNLFTLDRYTSWAIRENQSFHMFVLPAKVASQFFCNDKLSYYGSQP